MFEINGSHITQLNDADLRTLVARLCEAELRRAGLSVSAVTAGGHQDAADGGLDVRVELPASTTIAGFIPRPSTGFQVKVPDMQPAAILKEMRPKGTLRPVIRELAVASGSYIIVSATGSTAGTALQRRRNAMRMAAGRVRNSRALTLDFYDRERVASWVREHPGMVAWVREKIGQPIQGWRPYGNWTNRQESIDATYLADEGCRIVDCQRPREAQLPAEEGIRRMRSVLASPQGIVRLVGLSGMGKTRLVQALFDDRLGGQSLAPVLALYTDLGNPPEPGPLELMRHLIQNRQRAILVVDNCSPHAHRGLAGVCAESGSLLSLITVEFDVRDDDPEGTDVFKLEPSSRSLIEAILARQAPRISQLNRERIAEFSEGNARIAIALAHSVRRGGSVGNLTNQELFDRLFLQRQPEQDGLRRAAEACSLVYSFQGELLAGESSELPLIADLAGQSVDQLYRHIGQLRARGLIQRRGPWRAVLPQAIAIRLASEALERIAPERILTNLMESAPERLARSFTRRLGHLHDSESARLIVRGWLTTGGRFSDLTQLTHLQVEMVRSIAPVDPEAVLDAIERAATGATGTTFLGASNYCRHTWASLAKSIAYEAPLFQRAAMLLLRFALAEEDRGHGSAGNLLMNLFHLHLSGSHASIGQRLAFVIALLDSERDVMRNLGFDALAELLKSTYFTSPHSSDFGARPRDYGWCPRTAEDVASWYRSALALAQSLALSPGITGERTRNLLGRDFPDLWRISIIAAELESLARTLANQRFWPEGWIAVRSLMRDRNADMAPDQLSRLHVLEEELRPRDLVQRVQAYVLPKEGSCLDVANCEAEPEDDNPASGYYRVQQIAEDLGRAVAQDPAAFSILAPELVRGDLGRGWHFGQGLAAATEDLSGTWDALVNNLQATPQQEQNTTVLRGFLSVSSVRDPEATHLLLDAAVTSRTLGLLFPALQSAVSVGTRGAGRIERALQQGLSPIENYMILAWGGTPDSIPAGDLCRLLPSIASRPGGFQVAIEILGMRLHSGAGSGRTVEDTLVRCGRDLILRSNTDHLVPHSAHHLEQIAEVSFIGEAAIEGAALVARRLHAGMKNHQISSLDYEGLLACLFRLQPTVTLDEFIGGEPESAERPCLRQLLFHRASPVDVVPTETLIAWAQVQPETRFPRLAAAITPFTEGENGIAVEWTPSAFEILRHSPNRMVVLERYELNSLPQSCNGSLACMFEGRRALVREFFLDPDPTIVAWARSMDRELTQMIEEERSRERQGEGSFE